MSKTMSKVFEKEFRNMMQQRKGYSKPLNIYQLPIPEIDGLELEYENGRVCKVQGIKEEYYEALNGTNVKVVSNQSEIRKRQVLPDGTFRIKDGKYVYQDVIVKDKFIAVESTTNIKLKGGTKIAEGYRYVDFRDDKKMQKRYYTYIIPRECVYDMDLAALVITPNRHNLIYQGSKVALQNGNYLNIYIIPYKPRSNSAYRILGVKDSINFKEEVLEILKFWQEKGIIFNLQHTTLEEPIRTLINVGIEDYPSTCKDPIGVAREPIE